MTDLATDPEPAPAEVPTAGAGNGSGAFVKLSWRIRYADGAEHTVTTRPGDYARLADRFPAWRASTGEMNPGVMLYLAYLASRHDPEGRARPDYDAFLDDAEEVEMTTAPPRPTGADHGSDSRSSSLLPPAATLPNGSS